jgi:hypothetical protein
LNSVVVALAYAAVALAVIPIGFAVFRTQYRLADVALAAAAGAAVTLVPLVGGLSVAGITSLAVTVGVLFWRMRSDLFPDIVLSVMAARLATVPVLLVLGHR